MSGARTHTYTHHHDCAHARLHTRTHTRTETQAHTHIHRVSDAASLSHLHLSASELEGVYYDLGSQVFKQSMVDLVLLCDSIFVQLESVTSVAGLLRGSARFNHTKLEG